MSFFESHRGNQCQVMRIGGPIVHESSPMDAGNPPLRELVPCQPCFALLFPAEFLPNLRTARGVVRWASACFFIRVEASEAVRKAGSWMPSQMLQPVLAWLLLCCCTICGSFVAGLSDSAT